MKKNRNQLELSILSDVKAAKSGLKKSASERTLIPSGKDFLDVNNKASVDDIKIYNSISEAYFRERVTMKK